MTKKIISWVLVFLVIGFAIFSIKKFDSVKDPVQEETSQEEALPKIISTSVFMNKEGKTVPVIFYEEAVLFQTQETGDLVLPQVISASGTRYANEDESVVFWNKGNEITITQNNTDIFSGTLYDFAQVNEEGKNVENPTRDNSTLSQASWKWVSTALTDGTTITPSKKDVFSLMFTPDGKISGTTDCNSFGGTYTTGEMQAINFGEFASTQMYCEGSQESAFIDMITKTQQYIFTHEGNLILLLKSDAGSVMFRKK